MGGMGNGGRSGGGFFWSVPDLGLETLAALVEIRRVLAHHRAANLVAQERLIRRRIRAVGQNGAARRHSLAGSALDVATRVRRQGSQNIVGRSTLDGRGQVLVVGSLLMSLTLLGLGGSLRLIVARLQI
jgi:hypothetical protein